MYNQNDERIFFNQNMIYYKDKTYNSGGSLEVSICNNTTDYKTFSAPAIHLSVIGENNLRRLSIINYVDSVDLYNSFKTIIQNVETIYQTNRNNVLIKKYQFDRILKFEFIQIQDINERVVSISIIFNSSDFTKVVIPYSVFCAFVIGILKYFVNQYVDITFTMSMRNLMTEILEQNKSIKNNIKVLPSVLFEIDNKIKVEDSTQVARALGEDSEVIVNEDMTNILNDFDNFLGKDMENIVVDDLTSKAVLEEKKVKNEVISSFITKTLSNDMSILETMLTSASTRPDPMICLFEGFRRSMNLDENFSFLPLISMENLKSFLYISKLYHDFYLNSYINGSSIPSGFFILKYKINDISKINEINKQLAYDILLISAYMKIFRSRVESRDPDANKNGALFQLRIRTFLDPLVYSILEHIDSKIINSIISSNFEKYEQLGFFNYYQKILEENNFEKVNINDIRQFCIELDEKILSRDVLSINIEDRHDILFQNGILRIKRDNNLSIEQIINELIPLQVLEKNNIDLKEGSSELQKAIENYSISKDVLDIFLGKESKVEKVKISNISKTVRYFNNEISETYRDDFFNFIDSLKDSNFDFNNSLYQIEELGENIIKSLYVWNESDNKNEPLTSYRAKLEECILTKELILAKYFSNKTNEDEKKDEWNLDILQGV